MEKANSKDLVRSVIKSTMILELLSRNGELGISEIGTSLAIERTTVSRMVGTLRHLGYVKQNPENHKYSVTLKLFEMGMNEMDRLGITRLARPYMELLSRETGETVNLGILSSHYVLYVDTIQSSNPIKAGWETGRKIPVYACALGKVLLAYQKDEVLEDLLEEMQFHEFTTNTISDKDRLRSELKLIRKKGYSEDDEEYMKGLICLASPILGFRGEAMASLSLTIPGYRYKEQTFERERILDVLVSVSSSFSREIGFTGFIPT